MGVEAGLPRRQSPDKEGGKCVEATAETPPHAPREASLPLSPDLPGLIPDTFSLCLSLSLHCT